VIEKETNRERQTSMYIIPNSFEMLCCYLVIVKSNTTVPLVSLSHPDDDPVPDDKKPQGTFSFSFGFLTT